MLTLLVTHGWLSEDALVVVERSARSPEPRWPQGLDGAGERRYGETKMWFADFAGPLGRCLSLTPSPFSLISSAA